MRFHIIFRNQLHGRSEMRFFLLLSYGCLIQTWKTVINPSKTAARKPPAPLMQLVQPFDEAESVPAAEAVEV